ncbi:cell division protein SepF [Devriesea agamarum]|uniref:cell division protein SepF n=1 Tax=Devriesea agamarum TaxID=472569 RepID=UPI00071CC03D|nr:cell division protein SepF [Devriesea agamarum]
MAGALRKTMVYLGLAEDDDRYYEQPQTSEPHAVSPRAQEVRHDQEEREAHVTPIRNRQNIAPVQMASIHDTAMQRITTIHPRSYNDAKAIGESFRDGVPVIMNLSDMDDADAKRMVDFSAGLVFGLRGAIERVTNKVFLLSPEHVQIEGDGSGEESSFYNQS